MEEQPVHKEPPAQDEDSNNKEGRCQTYLLLHKTPKMSKMLARRPTDAPINTPTTSALEKSDEFNEQTILYLFGSKIILVKAR